MISEKDKQLDVVLLGPYGSGKTTQAQHLAKAFGYIHFDAGAALRNFINLDTEEAEEIKNTMARGELVPDHLTIDFFREAVETSPGVKFVVDGTPRSVIQMELFETAENDMQRDFVPILINISDKASYRRQVERKVCAKCKKPIMPEATSCFNCAGTEFTIREANDPKIATKRITIYHKQTDPVISAFRDKGLLNEVNGEQPIEKIADEIIAIVGKHLHQGKDE